MHFIKIRRVFGICSILFLLLIAKHSAAKCSFFNIKCSRWGCVKDIAIATDCLTSCPAQKIKNCSAAVQKNISSPQSSNKSNLFQKQFNVLLPAQKNLLYALVTEVQQQVNKQSINPELFQALQTLTQQYLPTSPHQKKSKISIPPAFKKIFGETLINFKDMSDFLKINQQSIIDFTEKYLQNDNKSFLMGNPSLALNDPSLQQIASPQKDTETTSIFKNMERDRQSKAAKAIQKSWQTHKKMNAHRDLLRKRAAQDFPQAPRSSLRSGHQSKKKVKCTAQKKRLGRSCHAHVCLQNLKRAVKCLSECSQKEVIEPCFTATKIILAEAVSPPLMYQRGISGRDQEVTKWTHSLSLYFHNVFREYQVVMDSQKNPLSTRNISAALGKGPQVRTDQQQTIDSVLTHVSLHEAQKIKSDLNNESKVVEYIENYANTFLVLLEQDYGERSIKEIMRLLLYTAAFVEGNLKTTEQQDVYQKSKENVQKIIWPDKGMRVQLKQTLQKIAANPGSTAFKILSKLAKHAVGLP